MINDTGIRVERAVNVTQILFNTEHFMTVGVIVDDSVVSTADADGKKIAKAGTPLQGSLEARGTAWTAAADKTQTAAAKVNGILLHDLDLTRGDNNGTVLIFGFVNLDRLDASVKTLLTEDIKAALPMVKFLK